MRVNRQWKLRSRPTGIVEESNFEFVESAIPEPGKGEILLENHWLGLDPDELVEELEDIDQVILGDRRPIEVGGFPATQTDATVPANSVLWSLTRHPSIKQGESVWDLEAGQVMRLIIVDTSAGSLLVTVAAHEDDWDAFLPVAEEILAGIGFPDL